MRFLLLSLSLCCSQISLANDMLGLPDLKVPADNVQTVEKIQLGKRLFNDKRLSADGTISCASCHQQHKGFSDGLTFAKGISGQIGVRNSPTIFNAAFYKTFFVDGRKSSLEEQALAPFTNSIEHGLKDNQTLVSIVSGLPDYQAAFKEVFKINPEQITAEDIGKAIASFERTLVKGNSVFDRYYFGRDKSQLSDSAARGLRIFRRKGNCANCHEISWNNALFTDNRFYNIGIGSKELTTVLEKIEHAQTQNKSIASLNLTAAQQSELGRFNVTGIMNDIGKFKTPTLRNIALTAPYMHDGSLKTLKEVIEYYDKGGHQNRFLDAAIFPLELTRQEKQDLEAFLRSLNSL